MRRIPPLRNLFQVSTFPPIRPFFPGREGDSRKLWDGLQAVADSRLVFELETRAFQLFAQMIGVDPEVLALIFCLWSPDSPQEVLQGDDLPRVLHQLGGQGIFGRAQLEGRAAQGGFVVHGIQRQRTERQVRISVVALAALDGAEAGDEFRRAEGLGHVVVGSRLKGGQLGGFLIADTEDMMVSLEFFPA